MVSLLFSGLNNDEFVKSRIHNGVIKKHKKNAQHTLIIPPDFQLCLFFWVFNELLIILHLII